jgi:hypothetical protein
MKGPSRRGVSDILKTKMEIPAKRTVGHGRRRCNAPLRRQRVRCRNLAVFRGGNAVLTEATNAGGQI